MTFHNQMIKTFEIGVFDSKQKMSEHEKLLFRAGIAFATEFIILNAKNSLTPLEYVDVQSALQTENQVFVNGELYELRKFFTEGGVRGNIERS